MKVHELFEDEEISILSVKGVLPDYFNGTIFASDLNLTSLEGSPSIIGTLYCDNNQLGSLKGGPTTVKNNFVCENNKLTSLEGAPSSVGGYFVCSRNKLTSLHNIHKQIKHIGLCANFEFNPITSCVLGLLLIDGLEKVYLDTNGVEDIINKHLKGDRDVFACQEELIEAGYEEFAQL